MRRNRLLENYPTLAHIGLESETQAPEVRKSISSISHLLSAINRVREKRMESAPLPHPNPTNEPLVTLIAGYGDGKSTSVKYIMEENPGAESGHWLAYRPSSTDDFLRSKYQNVLAQDSDKAKAKAIFSEIDIEPIYDEMERTAIQMLRGERKYRMYYQLFRRCRIRYSGARTASIVWDPKEKDFILRLNKEFLVYMSVMNLVNGHPKSTVSSLDDLYRDATDLDGSIMAHTLLYVLLHEMGHIFYQHSGRRLGLYSNFDPHDVNVYGDILINLSLTKLMGKRDDKNRRNVDPRMVPNIGLGKSYTLDGRTEDAQESVRRFVKGLRGVIEASSVGFDPDKSIARFRSEPATLLAVFNPAALVQLGVPTFVLLNLFKGAQVNLGVGLPPPVVESDDEEEEEEKTPTKVSLPLSPGQVVKIKATGERGVVVSVGEASPNPDLVGDFNQWVKIVPWSRLPEGLQKEIDDQVTRISAPPFAPGERDEEEDLVSTVPMGGR